MFAVDKIRTRRDWLLHRAETTALEEKFTLAERYQEAAEMLGEWIEFRDKHIDVC